MPLSGGTSGAHDDSMHQGNAKRDTVDGLAALDAGGHVLAPGYRFTAARGAAEQITIRERTSDERVVRFIRIGANDYEARVNVGGVEKVVQHAGLKDVANGIAALDAAGALLVPGSKIYYTRDGSDDVHIYERTSGEEAYAFHRVGANDYTLHVKVSNVWERVQTESMKDAVNGIAGLDASAEITLALLKTSVANGLPVLDSDVKVLAGQMPVPMLTVAQFQANAATGTAGNPGNANNTILIDSAYFDAIGEYVEVQFDYRNFITKYRLYGGTYHNEDGAYKIQHYEDAAWVDNTLNIPTNLAVWSAWVFLDIPVYTKAIRLVATAIDTLINTNTLAELEIEG